MPRSTTQNEQIRAESRQKIIDTARRLFAERGFDGCNVSDIAQQAGMSQGNIYWYFASKEAVLKAVLADGFEALGALMAEAAVQPGSGLAKLEHVLKHYIALAHEQGGDEFVTIVTHVIGQGGVRRLIELGFDTEQIGLNYSQSMSAIFAQGQAEGVFGPAVDAGLLTMFFFAFLNGLMLMFPKEWKEIPPEIIREAVLRLLGSTRK